MQDSPAVIICTTDGSTVPADASLGLSVQGPEATGVASSSNPFIIGGINEDGNVDVPPFHKIASDYGGGFGTYSNVLTDLEGYRDDFAGTSLNSNLTGTCTFTNGNNIVIGSGTAFTTDITTYDTYVRATGDASTAAVKIASVDSDTQITLVANYASTGGVGVVGVQTKWFQTTGTGGTIVVGSGIAATSELGLASGTTSGSKTFVYHGTYCAPVAWTFYAKVSNRRANQEAFIGIIDSFVTQAQIAGIVFTGTVNTSVTLRTSDDGTTIENNAATLPNSLTTDAYVRYRLMISPDNIALYANDLFVVRNRLHLPRMYGSLPFTIGWYNTGVPAGTSNLLIDAVGNINHDLVQVEMAQTNTLTQVQLAGYDTTGAPSQVVVDTGGIRVHSTCGTTALTNVASSASSVTVLAANTARLGATVQNDSTQVLYLKLGTTASTTSYTVKMVAGAYYEVPFGYTGRIDGIWAAANGNARVTELTV